MSGRCALLVAAALVCGAGASGCSARTAGRGDIPPNQYDLWALDVKSGHVRDLTRTKSLESLPAFSSDGKRIAFEGNAQGPGLYVMDADGRNIRRIARGHGANGQLDDMWRAPQWSPDGTRIAWATSHGCGTQVAWVNLPSLEGEQSNARSSSRRRRGHQTAGRSSTPSGRTASGSHSGN